MGTRRAVEMDKINPGFPGPVAENSLGRDGKGSESKRGLQSGGGGSQLYEVAPVKAIPH